MWLAPEQVRVLPITDRVNPYGEQVRQRCASAGLRATLDDRSEKIGAKIRDAVQQKLPLLLVVGEREESSRTVAVRLRDGTDLGQKPLDKVVEELRRARDARAADVPGMR